jgi:DNA-3-methyladenine glycosylase II
VAVVVPARARGRAAEIRDAVRATFVDLPRPTLAALAAGDDRVARLVETYPGVVPVLVPDPFTALIRSITAQQVNLTWAATVRRRLAERYGTRHEVAGTFAYSLQPDTMARATIEELRAVQLTTAKARSVVAVAEAGANGELTRDDLAALDDEALIERLTRLTGIGRWSAEWFLARTLGRPRVVAGDLGVRKAVGRLYDAGRLPSVDEVRQLTAHWGAAATIVQALALHDLAVANGVA